MSKDLFFNSNEPKMNLHEGIGTKPTNYKKTIPTETMKLFFSHYLLFAISCDCFLVWVWKLSVGGHDYVLHCSISD